MPEPTDHSRRGRAIARIVLGQAQMAGAVATAILLLQFGATPLTIGVAAATLSVSVLSLLVFRKERP